MGAFLFIAVLAAEALLYCLAKGESRAYFALLDKKEYPLKDTFLPMGYFLLSKAGYSYNSSYDSKLIGLLLRLHHSGQGRFYLQVHWAKKIGYPLLAVLLVSFLLAARGKPDPLLILLAVATAALTFLAPDFELKGRLEERQRSICLDFPDFISKLILLINAGMTVSRAWERVTTASTKKTPLYNEAARVILEISKGKSESQALEEFARRCRTPEITRFITVILQNLRKGNGELASILRVQADECWELRKQTAKRRGEEAETKLLLPLMLMFVAILLIVATPALLALKNM